MYLYVSLCFCLNVCLCCLSICVCLPISVSLYLSMSLSVSYRMTVYPVDSSKSMYQSCSLIAMMTWESADACFIVQVAYCRLF